MQQIIEVLNRSKQQLNFINDSIIELNNKESSTRTKQKALASIIVFGRTVTFVIQNLRSIVGEKNFNDWYQPIVDEMKNDELLNAFKNARNNLEKQGHLNTHTSMHIKSLDSNSLNKYMKDRPENAKSFFIGDTLGGSGWIIELEDGTTEKLYVDIDFNEQIDINVFLFQQGIKHKSKTILNTSIENCSQLYYTYLINIYESAKKEFLKN